MSLQDIGLHKRLQTLTYLGFQAVYVLQQLGPMRFKSHETVFFPLLTSPSIVKYKLMFFF